MIRVIAIGFLSIDQPLKSFIVRVNIRNTPLDLANTELANPELANPELEVSHEAAISGGVLGLREDLFDYVAVHIGQATFNAVVIVR